MPEKYMKVPMSSRKKIEKAAGRELAKLIYQDSIREDRKVKEQQRHQLIAEAIERGKTQHHGRCLYCDAGVNFRDSGPERVEQIGGSVFLVEKCPQCGRENLLNLFIQMYQPRNWEGVPIGEPEYMLGTKWYRSEDVQYR